MSSRRAFRRHQLKEKADFDRRPTKVEEMGNEEGRKKTAKTEGSQGVKKPDKGGLGEPLYQPKDGEPNVEYVCRRIFTDVSGD